jgi:S1-C subfamily serine protease
MDKPMPDQVFFPYPTADVIGLELDLRSRGTVSDVHPQSPAAMAGFDTGDILLSLNGQPIISHADVQWVLHHAKDTDELTAVVDSKGKQNTLKIPLHLGWREGTDISWRATTWDFRRMGSGGLVLEALSADECEAANIEPGSLALRVQYVGEYGEHAVGKRAGFQKDDIIISIDGRSSRMTESQWLAYAVQRTTAGQTIPATVLRNGQRIELSLMMQK